MTDVAIRVESLSKGYRLGQRERYRALRDVLADALYAPVRALADLRRRRGQGPAAAGSRGPNSGPGYFWALNDVSFEVGRGEVVGVIGPNGAGKSTLLKILSRITEPTRGMVELHGRVGCLLEVGTGFHPELTGRENIYLNGAILGMHKAEIQRKFDAIVDFAETEKFLDTPVKHYSSGMYVRLAFAVAAHLEPEILLVDEVLAVGDYEFQRKCLGKIGEVAKEGRTVVFVSHNMGAVNRLCGRVILLRGGEVADQGDAETITSRYLGFAQQRGNRSEFRTPELPGRAAQIVAMSVTDGAGNTASDFGLFDQVVVKLEFFAAKELSGSSVSLFVSRDGALVFKTWDIDREPELGERRPPGRYRASIPLPCGLLPVGTYTVGAGIGLYAAGVALDEQLDAVSFDIIATGDVSNHTSYLTKPGVVIAPVSWQIRSVGADRSSAGPAAGD